ncbi:hypothetical protein AJ85_11670 [Alkalihalobacillus alcalophilus ATCC 27647 = CGMCC 1.3604]|uniref:NDxxF motif lipoprotein n=1 Tax=Alkalihalobacillus alcalophilus ATCC 27647 = CGMCC 1.3604 TaxID=1218173 RepID=A0A094XDY0_ALKAL|nr:NDxxF motif lipoprotein [Alkalihalobacillus alcalophilus]KGA97000.1 hypothetical protein BALCAV_0212995 [Alkalihalobacillus alcalophilus ATCC 27647 = CGMCC 1.3604]MED1564193.1 NDxxF motif lipoprotein [Alkalihalobacillus alcalophilus]THG90257.1 hypothetical protein AJ85_11670 [Alkalihalobacillus alcalophilus ATCC 27647 = CGMCC 1.3604]
MRRIFCSFLMIFILSACSQGGNITVADDEVILPKNVEIPSMIFTSEKENSVIDEDEIKASIKTYLDSDEDLYNASYPFREIIYEGQELNEGEIEKLDSMNKLIKENDENFSNYILNNTLPEGYQEEVERISQYITTINEYHNELDKRIENLNEGNLSMENFNYLFSLPDNVNGREQEKIETFLDKKNIETRAFGR